MEKKVVLYSMDGWPACTTIKQFFADNQVDYELKDVRKDNQARTELVKVYKRRSVPVTIIGEEVIEGFIEPVLKKALGL